MGGWVGDREVKEDEEAVGMSYCELGSGWLGGWVEGGGG